MKKKVIFGAAVCVIATLSVVGMKANETASSDITLDGLVMTSVVNAECVRPQSHEGGWCDRVGHCWWSWSKKECDPRR